MVARGTDKINHCRTALAAVLVACFALWAFGAAATSAMAFDEVTLQLEPSQAVVKEEDLIAMTMVFVGGAHETTLILPMGADPSGILTYRATDVASGQEWTATRRDMRSFAADTSRRLPAGETLKLHHDALQFHGLDPALAENLPAGKYRIVAIYDEGRTFRIENRGSRVIRSEPAEIVVTPR